MFWILYALSASAFIYALNSNKLEFIIIGIILLTLARLWHHTCIQLKQLKDRIHNVHDYTQIMTAGNLNASKFRNLNGFQKIIYLTAFKAGSEFILRKLK